MAHIMVDDAARAEFGGRIDWGQDAPLVNELGQKLQPYQFGITWRPGRGLTWELSYAWVRGHAVRKDGTVGSGGRYARYRAVKDMPDWLGVIASGGPHRAGV